MVSTGKKVAFGVGGLVVVAGAGFAILASQSNQSATTSKAVSVGSFKGDYKNPKSPIKGGNISVTVPGNAASPASFAGYIEFSQWAQTSQQLQPAGQNMLNYSDKHGKFIDGGPANYKFDKQNKTVTITLRDNLKWSDGKPVTAQDVLFSLETIATNEVASAGQFTESYLKIKGMSDYQNGKAKTISGVKLNDGADGKKVTVSYTDLPAAAEWGDGVPAYALPYHDLKDVSSKDLSTSTKVTKHPLSFGPFKVQSVSSDSTVKYVRNNDYWGKPARLDTVTYYINQDKSKLENDLSKQKFDIVTTVPTSLWKDGDKDQLAKYNNAKGYAATGAYASGYWELYFNLGHFDKKDSTNVQDRQTPLQDVNVRKAVGYAMNVGDVADKYSNGFDQPAKTLVSKDPAKEEFYNNSIKSYHDKSGGDPKKAGEYLEKAGYKKGADGYYAKDGKHLTLTYLARSGSTNAEAEAKAYIAAWKAAGIDVKLYQDKLVDSATWQSIILSGTNNDWDLTDGGWSEGTIPTFDQLWAKSAQYNFGHVVSDALTKNLTETQDSKSAAELAKNIKAFQKLVVEDQAYTIPTTVGIAAQFVNGRVTGWTTAPTNDLYAQLGVSQDKPVTSGNPRK